MPLQLEIVTPEARVYKDTVESVVVPTTTGDIGILPGHIPLVTEVDEGEIIVEKGGSSQSLAVGKGFAECVGDRVSVLAENAIQMEEINEEEVLAAQERAEKALENMQSMDPEEVERLETTIRFARAQLIVKKRRR